LFVIYLKDISAIESKGLGRWCYTISVKF